MDQGPLCIKVHAAVGKVNQSNMRVTPPHLNLFLWTQNIESAWLTVSETKENIAVNIHLVLETGFYNIVLPLSVHFCFLIDADWAKLNVCGNLLMKHTFVAHPQLSCVNMMTFTRTAPSHWRVSYHCLRYPSNMRLCICPNSCTFRNTDKQSSLLEWLYAALTIHVPYCTLLYKHTILAGHTDSVVYLKL